LYDVCVGKVKRERERERENAEIEESKQET